MKNKWLIIGAVALVAVLIGIYFYSAQPTPIPTQAGQGNGNAFEGFHNAIRSMMGH